MGLMGADWHSMGSAYTDAASTAVVASFGVAVQRRGGYSFYNGKTCICICPCVCLCIHMLMYMCCIHV
jgi:hypothetical protein